MFHFLQKLDFHGNTVLFNFGDPLQRALVDVYPEVHWRPWLFQHVTVPKRWLQQKVMLLNALTTICAWAVRFWNLLENRKDYLTWLEGQLNIKQPADWYDVKASTVISRGGGAFLSHYCNSLQVSRCDLWFLLNDDLLLQFALQELIPEFGWKAWLFEKCPAGACATRQPSLDLFPFLQDFGTRKKIEKTT